ncbi:MAG: rubrerythrin family protein [Lachnospiraceae bacterium]|nr:rubrerythrin family protein [Lachnospiraceae bacterium]
MDFKNSKTYMNLQKAYEAELMVSTRYRIYAGKAKKEGFEQIGEIFNETAGNEQEHAEIWMRLLNNKEIPDTLTNLKDAAKGEHREWTKAYQDFANTAEEEGFNDIADLFRGVASIEKHHDYRFSDLAQNIEDGTVFCKSRKSVWICMNCGYLYFGECAPSPCPVCKHPQGFYKLNCEDY